MTFRNFSNQSSVCTATSTQSRMATTDSLTSGKPDTEGPTQDTVEPGHTGHSTDPIGSFTGSHSGSPTDSTATLSLAMCTADEAQDTATAGPADDPTRQDTDQGERTTALGARETASPPGQRQLPRPTQRSCQTPQQLAAKDRQQPRMASLFPAPQQSRQSKRPHWINTSPYDGLSSRFR